MQPAKNLSFLAMGLLAAVFFLGCSGNEVAYDTVPVEGVVTLDGEPVPEATVTFAPVDEKQGLTATGKTDEQGRYKLTPVGKEGMGQPGSGLTTGEYSVGVVKDQVPEAHEEPPEGVMPESNSTEEYPEEEEITHIVPQKYNNPRESGLKVTIEDGENDIPIEITSQ